MEDKLMPELKTLEPRQVHTGRLYRHYGRIVYAHEYKDRENLNIEFVNGFGSRISEMEYNRLQDTGGQCDIRNVTGRACHKCDFERLGLPCRCDFASGLFTGYYEVIHTNKQYSTNPIRPKIRIK